MIRLSAIMSLPARRPIAAIVATLFAALLAILLVLRLRADVSLEGMTSSSDPASAALDHIFNHYSSAEELLILATLPESNKTDPQPLLDFATRLEQAIPRDADASKTVARLTYRADAQTREIVEKVIGPGAMFYLSDAEFEQARQRLTPEGMAEQFRRNEQLIATPGPAGAALAKQIQLDPLRLHEFLLDKLAAMRPIQPGAAGDSDAFFSPDGRSLLLRISGKLPPSQIEFAKEMTAALSRVADSVNIDHLKLDISGAYPIAARSAAMIRRDSIISVVTSILTLALLFGIVYRTPVRLFLLAMAPVTVGVLLGFGVYSILKTTITPLTAVIGGILAGIGIDYSLQYLTHYHQSRSAGRSPMQAAMETTDSIGTAMIAAWATSIVGFIAIGFASVRMLKDFALAGSLCLGGAFLCTLVLLPAILVLCDRRDAPTSARVSRANLEPLVLFANRSRRMIMPLLIMLMIAPLVVLAFDRRAIDLDSDLTVLHPRPNPPLDAQETIAKRMGISPGSLVLHLAANSDVELLATAHDVRRKLETPAAKSAGITGSLGIATFLPDPRVAPARIRQAGAELADRVVADFDSVLAESSFNPQAFAPYRSFLRILLTQPSAPLLDALRPFDQIRETFLPKEAFTAGWKPESMMLIFTSDALDRRESRQAVLGFVQTELSGMPGVVPTGMAIVTSGIESAIRRDLPKLIGWSIAFVGLYLFFHFRSITSALLALLPTLFSLACVLGTMELSGQRLNLVNIVSIPLLIGIDVDYGIFLVSVARSTAMREGLLSRVATSGQAIVLCAATTLLGFGSIYFTSIPAIQSLGLAVSAGVIGCTIGSIFLLAPILLRDQPPRRAKTPREENR